MSGVVEGKVAIVTGAGRGIGREHALLLAREGAAVVVNDLGGGMRGEGADLTPAEEVVAEIERMGGRAIANGADVSNWEQVQAMVGQAIEVFGGLDIVVTNAGFSRDRMAHKLSEDDWDSMIGVHLKGAFLPCRFAAEYWRERSKQLGAPIDAAIVNTSSASGLYGALGQVNYVAAKAGVTMMTVSLARELAPFGVRANVVAPVAATRLFRLAVPDAATAPPGEFDRLGVHQVSPMVVWLCSNAAHKVSGQTFEVNGTRIALVAGWHPVSRIDADGEDWTIDRIDRMTPALFDDRDTGPGTFTMDL